jgi:hypothetical protein
VQEDAEKATARNAAAFAGGRLQSLESHGFICDDPFYRRTPPTVARTW